MPSWLKAECSQGSLSNIPNLVGSRAPAIRACIEQCELEGPERWMQYDQRTMKNKLRRAVFVQHNPEEARTKPGPIIFFRPSVVVARSATSAMLSCTSQHIMRTAYETS